MVTEHSLEPGQSGEPLSQKSKYFTLVLLEIRPLWVRVFLHTLREI